MPRFKLQHSYSAYRDGQRLGPWAKDDEVELDDAVAEWVERDSPGALKAVRPKSAASKPAAQKGAKPDQKPAGG